MSGFVPIDTGSAPTVRVTVDGVAIDVPAHRSLLAGLLAVEGADIDFFCAIGQCQQCVVRVNGRARTACLVRPVEGDRIETGPRWGHGRA